MATLKTPGVYIEEIQTLPSSVAQVATAIPAFIGYTEKLVSEPARIRSMAEFVEKFGGPQKGVTVTVTTAPTPNAPQVTGIAVNNTYKLFYAMQMYFANGGGPCWVFSAGQINNNTPAVNATNFTDQLALVAKEDEPTLIVAPEAAQFANYNFSIAALAQCATLQDRFAIIDLRSADTVSAFRTAIGTQNLKYGAAYYPQLETSLIYPDSAVVFSQSGGPLDGLTLEEAIAEGEAETPGTTPISDDLSIILGSLRESLSELTITLPPSSAIAGVYATIDATRGVWKSPANVSLNNVVAPVAKLNDGDQEDLNIPNDGSGKSINAIRFFTGKGVLVWGARTLDGNSNEWRYVSVRRFFNMAEESIKKATEFVVFEPNDGNTWTRVRAMIENYLTTLWRQGALAGAKPEDAFFVKVGLGETMTSLDILEGRLIVDIGMAAVRPAEFVVLRFSHKLQVS